MFGRVTLNAHRRVEPTHELAVRCGHDKGLPSEQDWQSGRKATVGCDVMRFGVLGSVAVYDGPEPVPVRWPMARSALAMLLLNANHVVPTERPIDAV